MYRSENAHADICSSTVRVSTFNRVWIASQGWSWVLEICHTVQQDNDPTPYQYRYTSSFLVQSKRIYLGIWTWTRSSMKWPTGSRCVTWSARSLVFWKSIQILTLCRTYCEDSHCITVAVCWCLLTVLTWFSLPRPFVVGCMLLLLPYKALVDSCW